MECGKCEVEPNVDVGCGLGRCLSNGFQAAKDLVSGVLNLVKNAVGGGVDEQSSCLSHKVFCLFIFTTTCFAWKAEIKLMCDVIPCLDTHEWNA